MKTITCSPQRHATQILAIFNDAIATSTALFDYSPRTLDTMTPWFQAKESGRFPVIGIEDDDERLLGFASYGTFRAWPAYQYTVEHSVYVHRDHRGRGLGRRLLTALIAEAHARDIHVLVGGIEASNTASIALHQSLGFESVGTLKQVGFKFGRWLDLSFYQLTLTGPSNPREG